MSVAHRRLSPAVATWTIVMTVSIGALASTAAGQAGSAESPEQFIGA